MRLALFVTSCWLAAVLVPAGLAKDSPPSSGRAAAGAERSAEKPKKQNHGQKVRECAHLQKSDKKTRGGHGERVRECAKKQREDHAKNHRMQQCRELHEELHAAKEELKADFRARFEGLKELPREEREAAARPLKQEYEDAKAALHEKFASRHEQCKELKERAEEHRGEGKARD